MAVTIDFDGFNTRLLDEHMRPIPMPKQSSRGRLLGGMLLAAGIGTGTYLLDTSGLADRAWVSAVSLAERVTFFREQSDPAAANPAPARAPAPDVARLLAERDRLMAKIEQMEMAAQEQAAAAELEQLRLDLVEPPKPAAPEAPAAEKPVRQQPPVEKPPILVARPAEPRKAAPPETKPVDDQAELMLFRKQKQDRAAAQPIVARAASATPLQAGTTASPVVQQAARLAPEKAPRPPVLLVEEGGVRVVGSEGERFIPIGGKLNGSQILATSPKIGLIVTEDSAIRVKNQEQ